MDGTLLNTEHQVSPRFFELYHRLKEKGIRFAAASGRQHNSIAEKLAPIQDEIIIIAENGGIVTDQGTEILHTPLDPNVINRILRVVEQVEGSKPVLCSRDNAYMLKSQVKFVNKLKEYYTQFKMLQDLKTYEGEVIKIAVFHFDGSEKYLYPQLKKFESELMVKVSGENWLDLSHNDANKGFALTLIQDNYRISREETLVFGDYNNDLEMLKKSAYSFAMANAHPNVLQAARYKTLSNNEMGVERVLEQLLDQLN